MASSAKALRRHGQDPCGLNYCLVANLLLNVIYFLDLDQVFEKYFARSWRSCFLLVTTCLPAGFGCLASMRTTGLRGFNFGAFTLQWPLLSAAQLNLWSPAN